MRARLRVIYARIGSQTKRSTAAIAVLAGAACLVYDAHHPLVAAVPWEPG
jgi:hypothetical protein